MPAANTTPLVRTTLILEPTTQLAHTRTSHLNAAVMGFAVACFTIAFALVGAAQAEGEPAAAPSDTTQATITNPTPTDGQTPTQVVEEFHGALLAMMKGSDDMSFDQRVEFLTPKMGQAFDLGFMSSKSVGRQWKKLSGDQQRTWREKFEQLTISNYAGRFSDYTGEEFRTVGKEPAARDTILVLTRVEVPNDEDVDLNYRLRETREGWRIIDIYLKGTVSELALRRSEYSSTLKRDGFEDLATAIDEKIAELREDTDG